MGEGISTAEVEALINRGESLAVEFKSEERQRLSDRDIYLIIVTGLGPD